MTPKDCDLDFDFDRDFGFSTDSVKSADTEEFDLDAILARELGPDFDAKFEEEYGSKYTLDDKDEEADFHSRNDFDSYGGPCYEIDVYEES